VVSREVYFIDLHYVIMAYFGSAADINNSISNFFRIE